uniref:Neprosin PEP catalytic domain-containing protein n=1 Tax=Brassica oleracea TaxID=3712 RepID=A0A3P6DKJ6_BRAOL|nr:unnamed protein product [Brassica oleracea]
MLLTLTILRFFYNGVHGTASLEIDMKLKALNKLELKTIKSEDGDIIDCVDIYKQPAFDHPALRNHKLQMKPSMELGSRETNCNGPIPRRPTGVIEKALWTRVYSFRQPYVPAHREMEMEGLDLDLDLKQVNKRETRSGHRHNTTQPPPSPHSDDHPTTTWTTTTTTTGGSACSQGTRGEARGRDPWGEKNERKEGDASLFIGKSEGNPRMFFAVRSNYLGAQTNINVWNPSGVQKGDYSSAQMWLLAGDQSEMSEVIEAGWMKDAYRKTGCINLLCSGFVQTSKHLALGAAIEPVSRSGHEQYYITVKIYQDSQSKNWWLASHDNVYGYWPRAIFKHLPQGATAVQWGGEVYSRNVRKKPHTKTPMGSGESPIQLLGKACYHTFIRIKDASMHPKYSMPLAEFSDENQCYTTILHKETNVSEPYLYFGGSLLKKKKKNFGGSGQSPLCR